MTTQETKEESDTPRTDAAIFYIADKYGGNIQLAVPAEFAAIQERRIAHLELALHQIKNGCVDEDDKVNEWYRSAPKEIRRICLDALEGKPL